MGITSFPASSGANRSLSNLGTTAINTALLPDTHNSYDLGSDAIRWQDAYIGNTVVVGVGSISHSVDAQIIVTRAVNDSIAGNAHAFSDSSDVTRGGDIGYNSFDARINILGTEDYNHYAGFQFGPVIATSGTIDKLYGYFHTGTINNGVIVNSYGFYIGNILGTGNITNQYGVYVAALSKGDNSNYAIYTAGTTRSHFEGTIECDQTVTFPSSGSIGSKSLGHHSSNYMYLTGGSAGLKLTDGGLKGMTIEDGGNIVPSTHNSYDFGSDTSRWQDAFFGGVLTCYDLVVESGSSIQLAGATFENQGHYTSVNTNWMVKHDDSNTAFVGVYAENDSVFTHANLILDAQGSVLNMVKNSPSHMFAPSMGGITNEDGNFGIFVGHDHEISFQHFESLVKDEYGNITNMTGMQSLMRITDEHLELEDIDLDILDASGNHVIHMRTDAHSFINEPYGLVVGSDTAPNSGVMLRVDGTVEAISDAGQEQLKLAYNDTKYFTVNVTSDGTTRVDNSLGEVGFGKDPEMGYDWDFGGNLRAWNIIADSAFMISSTSGVEILCGDENTDVIHLAATTNSPRLYWDQSDVAWTFENKLTLENFHSQKGGVLCIREGTDTPDAAEGDDGHQIYVDDDHQLYWMDQTGNSVTLGAWTVPGTEGIIYDPGSDQDCTIATVNVTGGFAQPIIKYSWSGDMWSTTRPLNISTAAMGAPQRWFNLADGAGAVDIYTSNTTPESNIAADEGSLAIDYDNAKLYIKTSGNAATGWLELKRSDHTELWSRDGTTLSPTNNGDNVILNPGGSPEYGLQAIGDRFNVGSIKSGEVLNYDSSESRWSFSGETSVWIGEWGYPGVLVVHAEDGSDIGAEIRWMVPPDHDDDISHYVAKTYQDDLSFGPDTDPDAFMFTGNGTAVTAAFNVDTRVNGTLGIDTAVPHAGIGMAKFSMEGPQAHADGPHIQYTTSQDDYPIFQQMNWRHNDIYLVFDAYYDNGWKSSNSDSNYRVYKNGDELRFDANSGDAQGESMSWTRAMDIDANALTTITTLNVSGTFTSANSTNWDTSYGWGDHSVEGYLTTETDPVFTAWDKSTGISITENQISDLDHFSEYISDLHGATVNEVAFGSDLGEGLITNNNFTYDGNLTVTDGDVTANRLYAVNGGVHVDRVGADSYVAFKNDGTAIGQIRANGTGLRVTSATGGTDHVYFNCANGDVGFGIDPSYDFHLEKDVAGYVTSRIYNNNADGITEHLVGAAGGGHLMMIANSTNSSHYDVPTGSVGLATTWGNKFTIAVGDSGSASEMMQFNGAVGTAKITANLGVGRVPSHKLDVNGTINTSLRVLTPELANPSGDLKIQPDVEGNVELFGDTNVANDEHGNMLYVRRQAAEGNEYMRFYITNSQKGMFHTSTDLTIQGQSTFVINSVTDDIIFKVGDNAGGKEVIIKNSDGTNVATIDSLGGGWFADDLYVGANLFVNNGNLDIGGDLDVGGIASVPAIETNAVLFPDGSTAATGSSPFTWHIGNAKYKQDFDMSTETDGPCGVAFKTDGTKMFVVDNQLDKVFEYALSTPWDVFSAGITANYVTTGSTSPQGIYFRSDGKKMYLADPGDDEINEYDLSTAWDITSAEWYQLYNCSVKEATPVGIHFRPDGRRMYIVGGISNAVNEYVLTAAWDITTSTWVQEYGTDIDSPEDLSFSSDGTKMYVVDGSSEDDIHEFTLAYPWDISTASLHSLYHVWEDSVPNGLTFSPDGTKMYIIGNSNDSVYEYDLGIVCHGNVAIGYSGEWGAAKLDVRADMDAQAMFADTTALATGVGGGVMFGGVYNSAGDNALGARIRTSKSNATENNYDFDTIFEVQNTANGFAEGMRLTTEKELIIPDGGRFGVGADPEYTFDVKGYDGVIARFRRGSQNKLSVYTDATYTDLRFTGSKDYNRIGTWIDKPFQIVANSTEMATFNGTDNTATFDCELRVSSDNPQLHMEETGADSNEKVWEWKAMNGLLSLVTRTDAYAAGYSVFKVDRNGTTPTVVSFPSDAQVSIGTDSPEAGAALDINSHEGALLVPRMTTTQRDALTAVNGMIIYNTTTNVFNFRENGSWVTKN